MATVTGARGTLNIGQSQRKVDMAEAVLLLQPDASPITVLTSRLNKKRTVNPQFSWQEDDLEPRFDAVNNGAGYTAAATSIVVDNGAYFAEHFLVRVTRTGELLRVTAVATNTLTVVRGVGSTAAALVDNDELLIVGVAQPEGDTSRPARSANPTQRTNYTQIFRTPVEMTGTLLASDQFTSPHDWDFQKRKQAIEHNRDKERAFLWGRPSEDTSGSQPRRTTAGAYHYVSTNSTDAAGALTETEFFNALRSAFRYGQKTKTAFASPLAADVLNTYPRGKVQVTDQGSASYGVNATRYVSPHGVLNVVTHWELEGTVYGGHILILDMSQLTYRFLANDKASRDTSLLTDRAANDYDGQKEEWLSEVGLSFGQEKAHAIITGITS